MPECERCGDFTDNPAHGQYHYCDACRSRFDEIEQRGVVVEATGEEVHIIVTAHDDEFRGGTEASQVAGLARGKYIADETGLDALFKYEPTGSRWLLDEYLQAHPNIRQDVHDRLSRVPERSEGLLTRVRSFL